MHRPYRRGAANSFAILVGGALAILVVLGLILSSMSGKKQPGPTANGNSTTPGGSSSSGGELLMYCAAGMRVPVEKIAAQYEQEYGVPVNLQYGGSNTLLSQIEVAKTGDIYLAADESYMEMATERGLLNETFPIAKMRLVIAVKQGNPKGIKSVDDLLRDDVKTALGNPDQAAIGKSTRSLLQASQQWDKLQAHVTETGVFKPTVPEVANDVKLGAVDAGIIWDTTVAQYPELEAVRVPELDAGEVDVTVGVLESCQQPTQALKFLRYLTAKDKGLVTFADNGFEVVDGDKWAEAPEITFYCGSVNRRAVDSVIDEFQKREGVTVNTVYNGCGILTAQMRTIRDQQQGQGFPDTYMACDRYYLDTVQDWFQDDVDISDTEVVIAVPKGNPGNIKTLKDLAKPDMRVAVGQPDQCTIGVLTKQLLEAEGLYDEVMANVQTQAPSSAMLVPTVTTNSVDAALAYATDTKAEADKVDTIRVANDKAGKAIQPFAIARSSDHKYLSRRLYDAIANSKDKFESAGFHFRVNADAIRIPQTNTPDTPAKTP